MLLFFPMGFPMMSVFPCLAHRPTPPVDVAGRTHEAAPALVVPEPEELEDAGWSGGAVFAGFGTSFLLLATDA